MNNKCKVCGKRCKTRAGLKTQQGTHREGRKKNNMHEMSFKDCSGSDEPHESLQGAPIGECARCRMKLLECNMARHLKPAKRRTQEATNKWKES